MQITQHPQDQTQRFSKGVRARPLEYKMVLQLPDGTGDTETVLRECEEVIEKRQDTLRHQIATTLHHTLEGAQLNSPSAALIQSHVTVHETSESVGATGREYEDQELISAVECVASGTTAQRSKEDAAADMDHSTAEKAGALAESIRTLISRTADERLESLNDRLTEIQAAFEAALQQLQFVDAAYYLQQLRREVEAEQSAAGVLVSCPCIPDYTCTYIPGR